MKQLDLFSYERDAKIDEVISKAKAYDCNFDIAAVFLPSEKAFLAEPSFAIKCGEKLKFYQILRGRVQHFSNSPLDTRDEVPNKYWIKL